MSQIPLAESLRSGMSGIARIVNSLISEKISHSEMVIFHMLTEAERETGYARIQLGSISRELCVSRPAVTQCVNRLADRGLLVRRSNPGDRRAVYAELTDKGREYFNKVKMETEEVINRIISNMGEENAEQLSFLLGELRRAITEEVDPERSF